MKKTANNKKYNKKKENMKDNVDIFKKHITQHVDDIHSSLSQNAMDTIHYLETLGVQPINKLQYSEIISFPTTMTYIPIYMVIVFVNGFIGCYFALL